MLEVLSLACAVASDRYISQARELRLFSRGLVPSRGAQNAILDPPCACKLINFKPNTRINTVSLANTKTPANATVRVFGLKLINLQAQGGSNISIRKCN
jgi:hypothetical protein